MPPKVGIMYPSPNGKAIRPIEYEPQSSDEREASAVVKAKRALVNTRPADPLVSNGAGNALAGTKVAGATSIKGGNPGPVGESSTTPVFK